VPLDLRPLASPLLVVALLSFATAGCGPRAPQDPTATPTPTGGDRVPESAEWERIGKAAALLRGLPADDPGPAGPKLAALDLDPLVSAVRPLCTAGLGACEEAIRRVQKEALPPDRLWALLASFRGESRARAAVAVQGLAPGLVDAQDGAVRDRFLRLAVATGVVRRGEPDAKGYRAMVLPPRPEVGTSFWVVIEVPSACLDLGGQAKGPDGAGRVDVALAAPCQTPASGDASVHPRGGRGTWVFSLPALPAGGLTLFRDGEKEPLAVVRPAGP
jgi:hypothetical protein